jgi:hypothetical protein
MKKEKSKTSKTEFKKLDLTDIETKQEKQLKSNIDAEMKLTDIETKQEEQLKSNIDEMKLTDTKIKLKLKVVNELMTNDFDSVVLSLINFVLERSKIGRTKYETDLDRTDGDLQYWIQNAIEEQLDNSLYLLKVGNVLNK